MQDNNPKKTNSLGIQYSHALLSMGGGQGMNITVNAVGAAADDPMLLARQLGWQLATR